MSRVHKAVVLGVIAAALLSAMPAQAAFPGKNGRIVFWGDCCDPAERFIDYLFTVNPDGTDLRRLPWPAGTDQAAHPAWSPDGKRIAFAAPTELRPGGAHRQQIWVMDEDGTDPFQVTHVAEPGTAALSPAWSPDGKRIAYDWINHGVWTINADGTDDRQLLPFRSGLIPCCAAWSPKGDLIAVSAFIDDTGPRVILTVRPDGTGLRVVAGKDIAESNLADPVWSPDGEWIAYSDGANQYAIRPDGSDRRLLITGNFADPTWSPDGTQIALWCGCFANGRPGIAAINSDGTGFRHVFQTPIGFMHDPDWQPIPVPRRSDYKNSNHFCQAEQAFWSDEFAGRYGGKANAFGKCVSQNH